MYPSPVIKLTIAVILIDIVTYEGVVDSEEGEYGIQFDCCIVPHCWIRPAEESVIEFSTWMSEGDGSVGHVFVAPAARVHLEEGGRQVTLVTTHDLLTHHLITPTVDKQHGGSSNHDAQQQPQLYHHHLQVK
jgi:hypothetical protein